MFLKSLTPNYDVIQHLDFVIRILIAFACGYIIGYERTKRYKEAGIRTHVIVCVGSALIMILSKYGFADIVNETGFAVQGVKAVDASRLAANVVSGVSFIGAGLIFQRGSTVKGLTTAAGV
ncbi:MAG: MgtC/SapB family protein [Lachnospiraceae bacterium]|nr:MgtC/SapB family protein [Lachnospiraceae bacterium]